MMTRRIALQLEQVGLLTFRPDEHVQLTPRGLIVARRIVREHRLLERYFIHRTDVSEGDADRGADYLEHSLSPELLWELDEQFRDSGDVPSSPHPLRSFKPPDKNG